MQTEKFIEILDSDFFTGVPDSTLKPLYDYLLERYGETKRHMIAANEGNAAALAAGYYLSTGKYPVVYMQNSGIGNMINPAASLLNERVCKIPVIFVVGWRGEPGTADEPQHAFQGLVTQTLLHDVEIPTYVVDKETQEDELRTQRAEAGKYLAKGRSVAFVIKKGGLSYHGKKPDYGNIFSLNREWVIERLTETIAGNLVVSTTGKTSRELYEVRERKKQGHERDFLTVGAMGHCSSLALSVALHNPQRQVWCLDGDGAMLMHMGALAVIGNQKPENLIHVVFNNEAHESVGGAPTVAGTVDLPGVARACGYPKVLTVCSAEDLEGFLETVAERTLTFCEIRVAAVSRKDLGRPKTGAVQMRKDFQESLSGWYDKKPVTKNKGV